MTGETSGITWGSPTPVDGESIRLQRDLVSERGAVGDVMEWAPYRRVCHPESRTSSCTITRGSDDSLGFWFTGVLMVFKDARVEVM